MGISYYKCVYCGLAYSEGAFEKEFYVPDEYECDYDVCDDCVEELFEVGSVGNKLCFVPRKNLTFFF